MPVIICIAYTGCSASTLCTARRTSRIRVSGASCERTTKPIGLTRTIELGRYTSATVGLVNPSFLTSPTTTHHRGAGTTLAPEAPIRPQRIAVRPVVSRRRLINDDRDDASAGIAPIQNPAFDERNPHGLKVAGTDR